MKNIKKILSLILCLILFILPFFGCNEVLDALNSYADEQGHNSNSFKESSGIVADIEPEESLDYDNEYVDSDVQIDEEGEYNSKEEVAAYIKEYGKLPKNYITKKSAEKLGWHGGGLDDYAVGKSIGGDHFGNYEGTLPEENGRKYKECDIDTKGKNSRGAKRIVYSNDGLIYYTDDHYDSFELLYGEE